MKISKCVRALRNIVLPTLALAVPKGCNFLNTSLRTQTVLCGVVTPCYQHHYQHGGVNNKVQQLRITQSEPLDYLNTTYYYEFFFKLRIVLNLLQ